MNLPFRRLRTIYKRTIKDIGSLEDVSIADCMMIGLLVMVSPVILPMIFVGLTPFFIFDIIDYVRQDRRNRTDTSDSGKSEETSSKWV